MRIVSIALAAQTAGAFELPAGITLACRCMGSLPTNQFDIAIYVCLFLAVVFGFISGLLRGLATIIGYVAAAPLAVAATPHLSPLAGQIKLPVPQTWVVFAVAFIVIGFVLGVLLRAAVGAMIGPTVSIPDRVAGGIWARCASACWRC